MHFANVKLPSCFGGEDFALPLIRGMECPKSQKSSDPPVSTAKTLVTRFQMAKSCPRRHASICIMVRSPFFQEAKAKSRGILPHVWSGPLVTRFQVTKSCPSEELSNLTIMIFDVDSISAK